MQILINGLCNGALIVLLAMAFAVVYVLGAYLTKQFMTWSLPWFVSVAGAWVTWRWPIPDLLRFRISGR